MGFWQTDFDLSQMLKENHYTVGGLEMNNTTESAPLKSEEESVCFQVIVYTVLGGILSIVFTILWYYQTFGYFPFDFGLFFMFYMCVGIGFWILSSIVLIIIGGIILVIIDWRKKT